MSNLSVSILIPTYKDTVALKLILDSLQYQTYTNFNIIIAEDDNSLVTKNFLQEYQSIYPIEHFFHEDNGNRKAVILNKALLSVESDYLIFIDGDVIPYSNFIESHVELAEKKCVLCGRRVNLGDKVSSDLRQAKVNAYEIEKNYLKFYRYLHSDNTRHYEQGFRFPPKSFLQEFLSKHNKNAHILGSNFSCYREDFFTINGFDESIVGGSKDDVDIEWRMIMSGCSLKSIKFCANCFHLNHARNSRVKEEELARVQMRENKDSNKFVAKQGIKKSK